MSKNRTVTKTLEPSSDDLLEKRQASISATEANALAKWESLRPKTDQGLVANLPGYLDKYHQLHMDNEIPPLRGLKDNLSNVLSLRTLTVAEFSELYTSVTVMWVCHFVIRTAVEEASAAAIRLASQLQPPMEPSRLTAFLASWRIEDMELAIAFAKELAVRVSSHSGVTKTNLYTLKGLKVTCGELTTRITSKTETLLRLLAESKHTIDLKDHSTTLWGKSFNRVSRSTIHSCLTRANTQLIQVRLKVDPSGSCVTVKAVI